MVKAVPLDKFIEHSLYDRKKGYYINKNPIGKHGDFITAPQISTFLDKTLIQADGPVHGLFAGGHIEAGQLNISRENISSNLVISFTKSVKMLYKPN